MQLSLTPVLEGEVLIFVDYIQRLVGSLREGQGGFRRRDP